MEHLIYIVCFIAGIVVGIWIHIGICYMNDREKEWDDIMKQEWEKKQREAETDWNNVNQVTDEKAMNE